MDGKTLRRLFALVFGVSTLGFSGLAACEREGPIEEAAEDVDEAVDDIGDDMEEVGEDLD
jgi:hypothetical protein